MRRVIYFILGVALLFAFSMGIYAVLNYPQDNSSVEDKFSPLIFLFLGLFFLYLGIVKPIRNRIREKRYVTYLQDQEDAKARLEQQRHGEILKALQGRGSQNAGIQGQKKTINPAYAALRVSEDAPKEVIAASYRALSKKYHPDVNHDPGADQIYKKVQDAWESLNKVN